MTLRRHLETLGASQPRMRKSCEGEEEADRGVRNTYCRARIRTGLPGICRCRGRGRERRPGRPRRRTGSGCYTWEEMKNNQRTSVPTQRSTSGPCWARSRHSDDSDAPVFVGSFGFRSVRRERVKRKPAGRKLYGCLRKHPLGPNSCLLKMQHR